MRFTTLSFGALLLATTAPAMAQDETSPPKAVTVSASGTITSDYRFRGLTQSNDNPAIQGTINLNSSTGFYVGTWASSIDGGNDGSTPALTGYGGAEVDLYAGYGTTIGGLGLDGGILYYYYPDRTSGLNTDFFEPYASVTYSIGPATAKVGAAYAWSGQDGLDFTAGSDDNLYVYGEASVAVPDTILTVKAHVGYTNGSLGLANLNPADDTYLDWSLTGEISEGHFTGGLSYVDTDISNAGGFAQSLSRGSTVLGYVSYSF